VVEEGEKNCVPLYYFRYMAATKSQEQRDKEDNLRAAGRCLVDCGRRGNVSMLEQLFKDHKDLDPNSRDGLGNGALHYATNPEIVKMVLAHGADPNLQNYGGDTPLHKQTWADRFEVVKILCDAGANPNLRNKKKIPATATCRSIRTKEYVIAAAMKIAQKQQQEEQKRLHSQVEKAQQAATAAGQKQQAATIRDDEYDDKDMIVDDDDED